MKHPGDNWKRYQMEGKEPPVKQEVRLRCSDCGTRRGVDKNHRKCRNCLSL